MVNSTTTTMRFLKICEKLLHCHIAEGGVSSGQIEVTHNYHTIKANQIIREERAQMSDSIDNILV